MGAMPKVPLVRSKPPIESALRTYCGTISPKPREHDGEVVTTESQRR